MWAIRQLMDILLLLREGIRPLFTTARDFAALEAGVQDLCQQAARLLLAAAMEQWDDRLWAEPGPAGTVVRKAPRKLLTRFGEVVFQRRYVRDAKTGQRAYPLVSDLGLVGHAFLSLRDR